MTELTDDYIKRVIAAAPFADKEAGIPQMVELIKALHAQLADAKAAQTMVVERAAAAVDKRAEEYDREFGIYDYTTGVTEYHGTGSESMEEWESISAAIRALADTDGLALVQALRAERDRWHGLASDNGRAALDHLANIVALEADRDRLAAANAALEAHVARLVGALPAERPDQPAHIVEYTNWRGEAARRIIIPIRMWWGSTEWHPEEQWMLTAWDCEKDAVRDFAWQDMRPVQNPATSSARAALVKVQADAQRKGDDA